MLDSVIRFVMMMAWYTKYLYLHANMFRYLCACGVGSKKTTSYGLATDMEVCMIRVWPSF